MILGYTIPELLSLFFVYGFLGWCIEVVFCGLEEGHFINRGFLNGPICPIYGFGGVIVVLCLTPIADNILLLFIGSAILTTLLEFVTGFLLDKIFHARWWDYSDKPFNVCGYICLKFSVYWGLVCIALMKGIHPAIYDLIKHVPHFIGIIVLIFLSAVFVADVIITVVTINNLAKRVKLMDDIANKIHAVSDEIGEKVYGGAVKVAKKGEEIYNSEEAREIREKYESGVEELKQKQEERREKLEKEIQELREKYDAVLKESRIMQRRVIKAFPKMKYRLHGEQLEKLKEKLKK